MVNKNLYIDVGCGKKKCGKYFIGIDVRKFDGVDFVVNIDEEKLPFKDNNAIQIYCAHTLEHCENIIFIMNEFWRVCKNGAQIYIIVPYGISYQFVQDPTHKTSFNEGTFRKYFCDSGYIKSFSDYGVDGFFREIEIIIKGYDILHLELHVKLEVVKDE